MAAEHPVPHYFVSDPSLPEKRRRIGVELRGRPVDVVTAAGVFSPGDLDKGTAALLRTVPDPQGTDLLDIGCGWGPITIALAQAAPEVSQDAPAAPGPDRREIVFVALLDPLLRVILAGHDFLDLRHPVLSVVVVSRSLTSARISTVRQLAPFLCHSLWRGPM